MKTQLTLVLFAILAGTALATVTNAGSSEDVVAFTQTNTAQGHTYALYFSNRDDGMFSAITGLFSADKEADFIHRLVDTDEFAVLKIDVNDPDLSQIAEQMRITEFPYVAVYFDADVNDVVAGLADEDTAIKILEHTKKAPPAPEPVVVMVPEPIAPTPSPAGI